MVRCLSDPQPKHLTIFIPMKPKPCQRAKHGNGFTYNPKETQNAKAQISFFTSQKLENEKIEWPIEGHYYTVLLNVNLPKPQDYWDDGKRCKPAFVGGDLDNHAKTVLDALQGILWPNDNRVTSIEIKKAYNDVQGYHIGVIAWPIGDKPRKIRKKIKEAK